MSTDPKASANSGAGPYTPPAAGGADDGPRGPAMFCSECRGIIRTHYFALNDRSLCARCKQPYAEMIERGTGDGSMHRATLYGLGAAIGAGLLLGAILVVFGFARVLLFVGVGWVIATAINKATGAYGARRYQILAVAMTYFALCLGTFTPWIKTFLEVRHEMRTAAATAANERAREAAAASAEAESGDDEEAMTYEDSLDERELETIAALEDRTTPMEPMLPAGADERMAKMSGLSVVQLLMNALLLFVLLPVVAMLPYGIGAAAIGLFGLGFSLYKAWDMTATGVDLKVSGPFKVGTGPIKATIGGYTG
jgi:hypothetical protein